MNIELKLVDKRDMKLLEELIGKYQKEILISESVSSYKYLASYWEKSDRYPYFIKLGRDILGFALVNSYSIVVEGSKSISEFYIKKEYRKKGIGKKTAIEIFKLFPRKWEIRELRDNISAQNFWRRVIREYTSGKYSEVEINNDKWNGYVQTFDNSSIAF